MLFLFNCVHLVQAGHDGRTEAMRECMQFKLVKGKRYERDLSRLDCMSASRFLLNRNLESCLQNADSQQ